MNDQQLERKVRKDAAKLRKDLTTLMEDSATQLRKYESTMGQATLSAKDDVSSWVGDSVSQLSDGINKITGDAKVSVVDAAAAVKKDVGHGLIQYNAKLQKVADKANSGFGKKAARYPWVAMSLALAAGIVLGGILRSVTRS